MPIIYWLKTFNLENSTTCMQFPIGSFVLFGYRDWKPKVLHVIRKSCNLAVGQKL